MSGHAVVGALAAAAFLLAALSALVLIAAAEGRATRAVEDIARVRVAAESAAERMILDLQFATRWDDVLSGAFRASVSHGPEVWTLAGDVRPLDEETHRLGARLARRLPAAVPTPRPQLFGWGGAGDLFPGAIGDDTVFAAWVTDDEADGDADPLHDANARLWLHVVALNRAGTRYDIDVLVARIAPAPGALQRLIWRGPVSQDGDE